MENTEGPLWRGPFPFPCELTLDSKISSELVMIPSFCCLAFFYTRFPSVAQASCVAQAANCDPLASGLLKASITSVSYDDFL